MKTLKFLTYTVFVLFLSVSITSCKGDDGATGPEGNANVKVGTLDLTSSDWLWRGSYTFSPSNSSSTSYFTRYVDIDVPEITENIHNTGLVLAYYKLDRHNVDWGSLPFHFTNFGGGYITNIAFRSEVSKIRLHYFWNSNESDTPTPANLETYEIADAKVKYIVIEGTAIGNIAARGVNTLTPKERIQNELENAGIDINNFYAVCEYYGVNPE